MKQKTRQRKGKEQHQNGTTKNSHKSSTDEDVSTSTNPSSTSPVFTVLLVVIGLALLCFMAYPYAKSVLNNDSESVNSKREIASEGAAQDKSQSPVEGTETGQPSENQKNSNSAKTSDRETSEQTKKTNKQNTKPKKVELKQEKSQEIPKEVRDFKATYLREMSPKKIFVDGRRLPPTELLPQKPNNSSVKVFLYDEFLSKEECDGLMKAHDRHVEEMSKKDPIICFDSINTLRRHLKANNKKVKVTPLDFTTGTTCVNKTFSAQLKDWLKKNWSYSTAFYPGESRFSKIFEYRVKEATALAPENGGKFQITSYPEGIGYKTHTDCREDDEKRDRMGTILVYLQDVEEGGETKFPELGIWAKPRKGRALVWNNMNKDGYCEPLSIHNAAKVVKGHKYILQRWYYYKSFYSLGKRPPEPSLPEREPGTPRVSCDEYDHGSCRWYDEWNYDHILEYQRQQTTLQ